ncbi:MerR family transcriptional regulator [soil metagenome]
MEAEEDDERMASYSIKDLERLSGVKAHTLRIWEQRFNIIHPQRTNTNIRYYNDADLRKLLNISLLNNHGYKISRIAQMSEGEIANEVREVTDSEHDSNNQQAALTICMIELDEERFDKLLSTNTLRHGFEKTMVTMIIPFLEKVGIMWMTGAINPAQEHFVSNIIRQKLIVAIDGQMNPMSEPEHTFMLFCPEGEYHEIGLLFMCYLLRTRKRKAIYLGASVPTDDLKAIYNVHKPARLFAYITTSPSDEELQQYIYELSSTFPNSEVWLAGQQMLRQQFDLPSNVIVLATMQGALEHLEMYRKSSSTHN